MEGYDSTEVSPRSSPSLASLPPANRLSEHTESSYASSEIGESQPVSEYDGMEEDEIENPVKPSSSAAPSNEKEMEKRFAKLQTLLKQSTTYSTILKQRMDEEKVKQAAFKMKLGKEKVGKKRSSVQASPAKRRKKDDGEAFVTQREEAEAQPIFQQPALITGATLKPYQLEGLQWMVCLDQNGMSGILADEMGLGKTLQTISFSAYIREHGNFKPFLIVCPLSVLHNWHSEYQKFAPDIPVCVYHGTKEERAELRQTVMVLPGGQRTAASRRASAPTSKKRPKRKGGRPPPKSKPQEVVREDSIVLRKRGSRYHPVVIESDSDQDIERDQVDDNYRPNGPMDGADTADDQKPKADEDYTASFPVVITTYDIIMRDRSYLQHYDWGYIVVDEGHRLKNLDCKLMREIKKYPSAGRMILTGTPLHNNLAELWSLLNFILPNIFGDLDTFQEWFNLPDLQNTLPTDQSQQIISSLHAILKPFLLRRMKADVELDLPPKKEYILYCPLSVRQREAYDKVLDGGLRSWLIKGGTTCEMATEGVGQREDEISEDEDNDEGGHKRRVSKRLAKTGRKSYAVDGDDDDYFEMVERGEVDERGVITVKDKVRQDIMANEHQLRVKVRQVNNLKLQNAVMQLRKVCSHPFLFDWPIDPKTHNPVLGEELVNASGKMMVLDRLLNALFSRGHKVLIFSQFKIMLDIIQDWAEDHMGWQLFRIDGETKPEDRRDQMEAFQNGGDGPDAPRLFLLSTRAGGLGVNLTAADTVIFYDQDWNPQMDAQAQDRAHRIGQTKPVLIFRLVSAHTIETTIMQRASEKRKLEALVIAKGKFKMPASAASVTTKKEPMAEMAASLLRLEGEKIEVVPDTKEGKWGVLSDEDLEILLDRSPEVFRERGEGWISSQAAPANPESRAAVLDKAAFAVY